MILHDRLDLYEPGGTDRFGNPTPPQLIGTFPAAVQPLTVEEQSLYGNPNTSTVRRSVILPPSVPTIEADWTIEYGGTTWQLDGAAEPHKSHGRTHHVELTMKYTTT